MWHEFIECFLYNISGIVSQNRFDLLHCSVLRITTVSVTSASCHYPPFKSQLLADGTELSAGSCEKSGNLGRTLLCSIQIPTSLKCFISKISISDIPSSHQRECAGFLWFVLHNQTEVRILISTLHTHCQHLLHWVTWWVLFFLIWTVWLWNTVRCSDKMMEHRKWEQSVVKVAATVWHKTGEKLQIL